MRSRTIREGSAGLLIIAGLAALGGLILWLRGFDLNKRSYRATIAFPNIDGMQVGAPVRYRGVAAGKISAIRVNANYAEVDVKISPATIVIPKKSVVETSQSGLVGETFIDITPTVDVPTNVASANPLAENCDSNLVVCDGDYIQGSPGITISQLTDSVVRFLDLFSTPEFVAEVRALTRNTSNAAAGVTVLTREVTSLSRSVRQELGGLSRSASASANSIGQAADQFGLTASEINQLLSENRSSIAGTLNSINRSSQQIEQLLGTLSPVLSEQDTLFENLQTLSANAVQASSNLRDLTTAIGSPENILMLQQTLDSARSTFQNAQKITSDLDDLTGDPTFRENVRELVNSLNSLVSSTQQLQQQTAVAQVLTAAEVAVNAPGSSASSTRSAPLTVLDPKYGVQLRRLTPEELRQDERATEPVTDSQPSSQ